MYKTIKKQIEKNTNKYQFSKIINDHEAPLTYAEFIELLKKQDEKFWSEFYWSLDDASEQLKAFFWECPAVSQTSLNKPFEFVATKSNSLNNISPNPSSFTEHFNKRSNNSFRSFSSLGKDAFLITPVPQKESYFSNADKDYSNLSRFTKFASTKHQQDFWQEVANSLETKLNKVNGQPLWLSTNGLGVHWLHVRIDNRPKYYVYEKYRKYNESENLVSPQNINKSFFNQSVASNDVSNYSLHHSSNKEKRKIVENIKNDWENWRIFSIPTEAKLYFDLESKKFEVSHEKKQLIIVHTSMPKISYDEKGDIVIISEKVYKKEFFSEHQWNEITRIIQSVEYSKVELPLNRKY